MNLLSLFRNFILNENLFSSKDKLLLAVSGGIDSVVLCELCRQAGYDFIIAHCNFQLRGAESESDQQFVQQLAARYNVPLLVKRFNTNQYAKENKVSIQVAARDLRYAWFLSIINNQSWEVDSHNSQAGLSAFNLHSSTVPENDLWFPTHLVTAHHLNDNIETMLINFFKGTGITGLRGIVPKQGKIVRPLLFAKKEDLKNFAAINSLDWAEDSSNQDDKYTRNYFRNQLIPLVENIFPEAEHNLADNLQRFKDAALLYNQSITSHKKKLLEIKGNEVHIPVLKLLKSEPLTSIVYEIIKEYHFSAGQVPEVISLLKSETGRYIQSSSHRVIRNRSWLIISPNQTETASVIVIEEEQSNIVFEAGSLQINRIKNFLQTSDSLHTAALDAAEIQFPLLLRKWKTGDYFYPLGMRKKKKLARFFIDRKLSKTDKEKIWVVESGKKIIWIIGHRIDDRCKITSRTKQVLQIELLK